MGNYRGTVNRNEPDDTETAYFVPSYFDDIATSQSVAICPINNREVSVIFCKISKLHNEKRYTSYTQFWFTEYEVNMLIDALIEAKKRWDNNG
jgi:hypothetical protein